ncbi:hypothetical protein L2725_06685 [Shewanella corallii]|uniref:Rhodanese domain-containing protein n=1 Tax=Shewanella corallii TaxID=560080 RepID=A0ABT0N4Y6_9GAMM|nr:rhodanese-like domain-containing protein [Shewanella corallii]MCL2913474.1 hypothetical protein [Shewanella corallii]
MMMINSQQLVNAAKQLIREIAPDELLKTIADVTIIDVREKEELSTGTLPNAIHIPRGTLEMNILKVLPNIGDEQAASTPLVIYCRSGARSALASLTLQSMGFTRVQSLQGGMTAWLDAQLPIAQ